MTPEQEEKCVKFWGSSKANNISLETCRRVWRACLEANGIGEDVKGKDDGSAAPQWVIDMIRTGKPVWCRVWDDEYEGEVRVIQGYILDAVYSYQDEFCVQWKYAEPIPAWKPKDGEAVLTRVMDHAEAGYVKGGYLYVRSHRIPMEEAECKPFDESRLGWLWSEI